MINILRENVATSSPAMLNKPNEADTLACHTTSQIQDHLTSLQETTDFDPYSAQIDTNSKPIDGCPAPKDDSSSLLSSRILVQNQRFKQSRQFLSADMAETKKKKKRGGARSGE